MTIKKLLGIALVLILIALGATVVSADTVFPDELPGIVYYESTTTPHPEVVEALNADYLELMAQVTTTPDWNIVGFAPIPSFVRLSGYLYPRIIARVDVQGDQATLYMSLIWGIACALSPQGVYPEDAIRAGDTVQLVVWSVYTAPDKACATVEKTTEHIVILPGSYDASAPELYTVFVNDYLVPIAVIPTPTPAPTATPRKCSAGKACTGGY